MKGPLTRLVGYLVFELWLVVYVSKSTWVHSDWAKAFVGAMSAVAPAVHHLDRIATDPVAVSFILAISPFLLVPKVVFWVQWLYSDRMRILRYFVVSPLTKHVPKNPFDFITDPLRTDAENKSPDHVQEISMARAIFVSLAVLVVVIIVGIVWPWGAYGYDVVTNRDADFREIATAQGGWSLWLSWFVYQMNLSAGVLAMGYCILTEYFQWLKKLVK